MTVLRAHDLAARRGMVCQDCEQEIPRGNHAVMLVVQNKDNSLVKVYTHFGCYLRSIGKTVRTELFPK